MRKGLLFALLGCAAISLGLVSFAPVAQTQTAQTQTPGQQAPSRQTQTAGQQPPPTPGKQTPRAPSIPAGYRLLTLNEGRAIAEGIAWADDEEGLAPDCSHLVHALYTQAGFPYSYTSSLDLYRGAKPFWRVRYAHPGDLVVWPGHVGIVINPNEHSFFSTTKSGARLENYRSGYWRTRGSPHFYRYLTKAPLKGSDATSEAADRPSNRPPQQQAVLGSVENRPREQANVRAVKSSPNKAHTENVAASAARTEISSLASAPAQILLPTKAKQPNAADVTSALEAANLEAGEMLRAGNLEKLERPVVVYRQLRVSAVEVKGKRGIAQIQLETVAALTAERMESQLGWEDHQLELQRTKKGWVTVQGNEIAYVPRDGAMRILAARLAALTQSAEKGTAEDREQSDIVRFMNLLIE